MAQKYEISLDFGRIQIVPKNGIFSAQKTTYGWSTWIALLLEHNRLCFFSYFSQTFAVTLLWSGVVVVNLLIRLLRPHFSRECSDFNVGNGLTCYFPSSQPPLCTIPRYSYKTTTRKINWTLWSIFDFLGTNPSFNDFLDSMELCTSK